MKNINNQLLIVANLYKISLKQLLVKDSTYITPEDNEKAWTNGYIADMGGKTKPEMEALATLLNVNGKMIRFLPSGSEGQHPKLSQIIPEAEGEPVTDILTDFRQSNIVKLQSENISCWVNPEYLAHFINNYSGCEFRLVEELKPIKVILDGEVIGVVMPIRIQE